MDYEHEATYHYVLSDVLDLIRQYGYARVINDLDQRIADEVSRLTDGLV